MRVLRDSLIEFKLLGVGALDIPVDEWVEGQPSGLKYRVGVTNVLIRASIPSLPYLGYSDTCSFNIQVLDKEAPVIVCQDITVPVGASCDYLFDAGSH